MGPRGADQISQAALCRGQAVLSGSRGCHGLSWGGQTRDITGTGLGVAGAQEEAVEKQALALQDVTAFAMTRCHRSQSPTKHSRFCAGARETRGSKGLFFTDGVLWECWRSPPQRGWKLEWPQAGYL